MTFNIFLTVALAVCLVGLLFRVIRWFTGGVTAADRRLSAGARLKAVGLLSVKSIFGPNLKGVLKALVLDGLFQIRLYRADRGRWAAHLLIFWGFTLLLLFHALDGIITDALFSGYESTLNPWPILRNLLGLMVLIGLFLTINRRLGARSQVKTTVMDVVALALVGAIVGSGFLVEAAKIVSQSEFHRMIEEFHDPEAVEEVEALEAYWTTRYGLAPSEPGRQFTEEQLELGREVNEYTCLGCHSRPQTAYFSFALSRLLTPFGRDPDQGGLVGLTYWLHVLFALGLLAWLPFGKMRHVVTAPFSCLADRCARPEPDAPARAVRRLLDLDACTRCGLCSDNCSVGICAEIFQNQNILPSEKLAELGRSGADKNGRVRALLEGLIVCTNCLRCTGICPVGINLQDLWDAVREDLSARGLVDYYALSPLSLHRREAFPKAFQASQETLEQQRDQAFAEAGGQTVHAAGRFGGLVGTGLDDGVFRLCFSCKTCTSSCPVVGLESLEELGLAPHQIIHATALGLDDLAASSRMLWACLGCYRCQENCPQGVRVTDVLYIHKNKALARLKGERPGKES